MGTGVVEKNALRASTTAPTDKGANEIRAVPVGQKLRYGENPYQESVPYRIEGEEPWKMAVLKGDELSHNNYLDIDKGVSLATEFDRPACVVTKHASPTGVAEADRGADAVTLAMETDPVARYGCGLTINFPFTMEIANAISELKKAGVKPKEGEIISDKIFIDVLVIPGKSERTEGGEERLVPLMEQSDGMKAWLERHPKLKLVACEFPNADGGAKPKDYMYACGRLLRQDKNVRPTHHEEWKRITGPPYVFDPEWAKKKKEKRLEPMPNAMKPEDGERLKTLAFAWKVAKHARSNAVVLARGENGAFYTVGIGSGQTSRIKATRDALEKAGERADGAGFASDAFFPFRDSADALAAAGAKFGVYVTGSIRDADSVKVFCDAKVDTWDTGYRVFAHK